MSVLQFNVVEESFTMSEIPDGKHLLAIDDIYIYSKYYQADADGLTIPRTSGGSVIPSIRCIIFIRGIVDGGNNLVGKPSSGCTFPEGWSDDTKGFEVWIPSSGLSIGYIAEDLIPETRPGFAQITFKE